MTRLPRLIPRASVLAVLIAVLLVQRASNAHESPTDSTLTGGRVSVLDTGEYVVSLDTAGAYPGMVTLKFTVNADGTIESGEWAVVVSYVEDLNPDGTVATHPEAAEESGPHQEFIRLINKGTLSGTIASGAASTSASGALILNSLQLQITNGTMTFETFGAGVGSLDADLSQAAQGLLHLEF